MPTPGSQPPAIGLAYLTGSFGLGLMSVFSLLVPLRAQDLMAPVAVIGIIVGAAGLAPLFLAVPLGQVIDRVGARRAFVIGASLSTLISIAFVFVDHYWALFALQLTIGISKSMSWVAAQTYVTSLGAAYGNEAVVNGRFSVATNAGVLIGPLLAGAVAGLVGFRLAFFLPVAIAAMFIAVGLALPDDRLFNSAGESRLTLGFKSASKLVRTAGIQMVLVLTFIRVWSSTTWQSFYPIFLSASGLPPSLIGSVPSAMSLVAMVVALGSGRIATQLRPESTAVMSLGVGAVGMAISPYASDLPAAYLPAALIGVGNGLSLPALLSLTTMHTAVGERGLALGVRASANQAALLLTPATFGLIVSGFGLALAFTANAVLLLVALGGARLCGAQRLRGADE